MNNVMSVDSGSALGRLQDSAEHPDHSGFPRAIRPEKAKDRSFTDAKRNVIDCREAAEPFGQPFALDHRFRHITLPLPLPLGFRLLSRLSHDRLRLREKRKRKIIKERRENKRLPPSQRVTGRRCSAAEPSRRRLV